MKLFSVFVVVFLALCTYGTAQNMYCGRRLALALAMLCEQPANKRAGGQFSLPWHTHLAWPPRAHLDSETGSWLPHSHPDGDAVPWVSESKARAIGRGKRQIVMECCMKPCSEDELRTYC